METHARHTIRTPNTRFDGGAHKPPHSGGSTGETISGVCAAQQPRATPAKARSRGAGCPNPTGAAVEKLTGPPKPRTTSPHNAAFSATSATALPQPKHRHKSVPTPPQQPSRGATLPSLGGQSTEQTIITTGDGAVSKKHTQNWRAVHAATRVVRKSLTPDGHIICSTGSPPKDSRNAAKDTNRSAFPPQQRNIPAHHLQRTCSACAPTRHGRNVLTGPHCP